MRRATAVGLCLALLGLAGWTAEDAKTKKTEIGPATFEVPADWQTQRPSSQFRKLQWGIPTAEGDETAPVFYVSTAGGGVEANIKRWIDEYEDQAGEPKKEKIEANGIKVSTVDVGGTFKGGPGGGPKRKDYRTLGAVVEMPGADTLYFFKMLGPTKSVSAQRDAFIKLCKSGKPS
jgi:hypothetical protein